MYAGIASVRDDVELNEGEVSTTPDDAGCLRVRDDLPTEMAGRPMDERLGGMLQQLQRMETRNSDSYIAGILLRSPCVTAQQIDVSLDDVEAIFRHVSALIVQRPGSLLTPTSVADSIACRYPQVVLTGYPCLDRALMGGIGCGWITEFTGPMGAGKTALALHVAMHAASHMKTDARKARTLWITSDRSAFPAAATAEAVLQWHVEARRAEDGVGEDVKGAMCDIAVTVQATLSQLVGSLPALQQYLRHRENVRLVVIDGLSILVRRNFPGVEEEVLERHEAIANLMNLLKGIAHEFSVAVVVTTHSGTELGHAFVHAVNARLRITRCWLGRHDAAEAQDTLARVTHVLEVAKSPVSAACRFECDFDGLRLMSVRSLDAGINVKHGEDVALSGVDPLGHLVVPTFVYC